MDLGLKNKVIIVTGGAKGIGNEICNVLAEEGAIPVIAGRGEEANKIAVKNIEDRGGNAFYVTVELGSDEASDRLCREVIDKFGRIEGLVNNAGLNDGVSLENGTYETFVRSLHRSVIHYYLTAHYALPELIKSHGPIVNIASKTAETGQGDTSGYAASNGGRLALTREWAVELLKYHIRVNAIVVSECFTPQYAEWVKKFDDPEAALKVIEDKIPFENRMTTTREIANTAAFLLSERSSHTTGQWIHVDGGYVHLDRAVTN